MQAPPAHRRETHEYDKWLACSDLVFWNTLLWLPILARSSLSVFSSLYPSRKATGHYVNHGDQVMRRLTYSRDKGIHFSTEEENNGTPLHPFCEHAVLTIEVTRWFPPLLTVRRGAMVLTR